MDAMEEMQLDQQELMPEDVAVNLDTGQPMPIDDPGALASEGMHFASRHMQNNGPTRPLHRLVEQPKITKAQLEEQKVNETQGYPSNLDEASKVKALEAKVSGIESGINAILTKLNGELTTIEHPDPPILQTPVELLPPPGPKMSLGSAPPTEPETETEDEMWDDLGPDDPEPEPQETPKSNVTQVSDSERTQLIWTVEQVYAFMKGHNCERTWRRLLTNSVHRNLGYNAWPTEFQTEWRDRFKKLLADPQFVTQQCQKILTMEFGRAIGAGKMAAFVVSIAGHLAFFFSGNGLDQ